MKLNRKLNFDFYNEYEGWHWKRIGDRLWHITEKNTADALRFLEEKPKDKPFFLNVAYYATHAVDNDVRQYRPQRASMTMYRNDTIPEPEDTYDKMPYFFTKQNEGRNRWRWRFDTHDKHQRMMKNYYRMASEVDSSVGIIIDQLQKSGELNNTMIIFTTGKHSVFAQSSFGFQTFQRQWQFSRRARLSCTFMPTRAYSYHQALTDMFHQDKWYPHQESIRVPLIIKDPRMDDEFKGTTNEAYTLNVDLTATILSAAGVHIVPTMMGRDMSVLYRNGGLKGEPAVQSRRMAFTNDMRQYPQPAKDGDGKYHCGSENSWRTECKSSMTIIIVDHSHFKLSMPVFYEMETGMRKGRIPASEALVRKDYKYFFWPQYDFEQLFDIRTDPKEMNDLVNSTEHGHQKKLQEMRTRFKELKDLAHSDLPIIL